MSRALPLLLLIVFAVAGFVLLHNIGWDSLARHHGQITTWVSTHPVGSAALFALAYLLTAALSLPHGALMTVAGGLLFGPILGSALSIAGATTGATIMVVVVRSIFAKTLARQRHRIPEAVQIRLRRDGFNYLLALRLIPLFPFWLVNLAAAIAGTRLAVFVPATLLGIAPASFVLSATGAGLGTILAEGRQPDLSVLASPRILLPLLGLAVLSLLPVLLRRNKAVPTDQLKPDQLNA